VTALLYVVGTYLAIGAALALWTLVAALTKEGRAGLREMLDGETFAGTRELFGDGVAAAYAVLLTLCALAWAVLAWPVEFKEDIVWAAKVCALAARMPVAWAVDSAKRWRARWWLWRARRLIRSLGPDGMSMLAKAAPGALEQLQALEKASRR
jgi:hypothetical protein